MVLIFFTLASLQFPGSLWNSMSLKHTLFKIYICMYWLFLRFWSIWSALWKICCLSFSLFLHLSWWWLQEAMKRWLWHLPVTLSSVNVQPDTGQTWMDVVNSYNGELEEETSPENTSSPCIKITVILRKDPRQKS